MKTLFPIDLPSKDWVHFKADGYKEPACGVVYRMKDKVANGMPLGGIDTGCIDLETSGLLGYSTIFNTHVPRRGPINLPILGLSVEGKTWVLCDKQPKQGEGWYQQAAPDKNPARGWYNKETYKVWHEKGYETRKEPLEPIWTDLNLNRVETAKEIHYWGHYPIVDIEFETTAPVSTGLRAWSSFIPGDVIDSMIPGIVFEIHLRNKTKSVQKGTTAFSFPGPTLNEAGTAQLNREKISGKFSGVCVRSERTSYVLGVIDEKKVRIGSGLGADGPAWAKTNESLPQEKSEDPSASIAVDFSLKPEETKIVRFVLTWSAPLWNAGGYNWASKTTNVFTHVYAKHYPDAIKTAQMLAERHADILRRIIAWQEVVYTENKLPVWLRDSLINILYLITEDGLWAQAKNPIPEWVKEEDGLFGMNECPRADPQTECIPCTFYGNIPLVYFFPEAVLSNLRGYKGYQYSDGAPSWVFGGFTCGTPPVEFAGPARGYQFSSNGISLTAILDRFLMCCDTPDKKYLKEFYPMIKKTMIWTVNLRTTPSYSIGERVVSMPNPDSDESLKPGGYPSEWFEAAEPGWLGMTAHIGSLHLAQLRIVERMAMEVGDKEFAKQCADWIKAGAEAMENKMWAGSYYLNYFEPDTGRKSDFIFGYQLDGEWIISHHGLTNALPEEKIKIVLETIKKNNMALSRYAAVNYANPDGTPIKPKEGAWDYGTYSYFPPESLMLAMTYMYNGQKNFGLELARKLWHNLVCLQGYTWDMPNIMRGDIDTGKRIYGSDYYQDMILWSLPAAIEGTDLAVSCKEGGLVQRIIEAGKKR